MKGFMVIFYLAVMGVGVWLGFFADTYYSGEETFHTEQEYTLFKEAISNPDVRIQSLQSLSSEPPIIVNFRIEIPNDKAFPYGQKDNASQPAGYALALFGFGALSWILFYNPKEEDD